MGQKTVVTISISSSSTYNLGQGCRDVSHVTCKAGTYVLVLVLQNSLTPDLNTTNDSHDFCSEHIPSF